MILQYRGYRNNLCYEEADSVTVAPVYLADLIKKIKYPKEMEDEKEKLNYLGNEILKYIGQETGCWELRFVIGNLEIKDLENVFVVDLKKCGENGNGFSYVFVRDVLLLNDSGKTILKVC